MNKQQAQNWQTYIEAHDRLREQSRDYRAKLRVRYWNGEIDITAYRDLMWLNQCMDGWLHRRYFKALGNNLCHHCGEALDEGQHAAHIPSTTNEPESVECFPDHIQF